MTNENFKLWNRNFLLIMFAAAGVGFASNIFISTTPIYAQRISDSAQWAGAMTAIFSVAALLARPVSGYFVDRINRGVVAFAGGVLCLIGCFLYNYSANILMLVIVRCIHGFGFGLSATASNTIAVDMIPLRRRVEGIGIFGLCMTIPSAIGPVISLSLITQPNGMFSLGMIGSIFVAVSLIALVIIKYPKHEVLSIEKGAQAAESNEKMWPYYKKSLVPAVMLISFAMVQGAVLSFIAIYAFDIGFESIGLFFTLSAGGVIVSRLFAGKLGDRHGVRAIMIPSFALLFVTFLGIINSFNEVFMILMGLPYGLAIGTILPGFNVTMLNIFPEKRRGVANSLYFICIDIGMGCSLLWGIFADYAGYKAIFVASAVICILLFFGSILYKEIKKEALAVST